MTPSECPTHGPFAPARFCCGCVREKAYKDGYLAGLRMAAAAVPGDVDQPALRAIDAVIETVKA